LIAQSELLERKAIRKPDAPADLRGLQKLKREAHRLNSLVRELLDATRTEQGKLVEVREEVDLVAFAHEVCEHHSSERHPCTVEASGPVVGQYDGNRILQLMENLVENAVKYSPEGGPVLIRVWSKEGRNHLTISDTVIGIPKEDLAHVFERFHRGTNVNDRRFAGMGLGLFICKGIVEQHGGRIWVEHLGKGNSRVGSNGDMGGIIGNGSHIQNNGNGRADRAGTTFHVELPALAPVVASMAAATEASAD
jgi:signal transduction histidine kinase